jgi:putative DNA primase/helicase
MHPNDRKVKFSNIEKLNVPIKYPDMDGKKVLDTRKNLKLLLDLHKITVKWNIMLRLREIFIPGVEHFIDEKENADLAYIYELAVVHGMPHLKLDTHLTSLALNETYHPIVDCILKNPWDKKPRLNEFIATIKTKDSEFSYKIIKKWMLSAIASAFSKVGFSNQGVLVLQGEQNIGKTRWVKSLDPINCGAVKEGLLVDPNNKDSVITASQCWIAELGELDGTFSKADIARLKSFITSSVDIVRLPYNSRNSYLHRRTAYIGTVNNPKFLVDDTGNRRWWTVEVESIDLEHKLDIQQVWAEVYDIWSKNKQTWLTHDELSFLNEKNKEHEQIDPLEEKFLEMFDWKENWKNGATIELTCTQILEKMGRKNPTKHECNRLSNIIRKHTGLKSRKSNSQRLYLVPFLSSSFLPPQF